MSKNIQFPPWPYYSDDEIDKVVQVLQSGKVNYWTGQECKLFESEFAQYVEVKYGIALANGTVALELALRSLGIGPGDEVVVPSRSFFATASCVVACGAIPVFADIDLQSQNITVDTLSAALTQRTRAVIVVHHAGWPCEMMPILEYAKKHDLFVIEDCAQAHGATIDGKVVGSFGDAAAYSFCQDKIMSTGGEGGLLLTNNRSVYEKAWSYKDHGKSYTLSHQASEQNGFRWLHESFGSNYRMTEMQAAIGLMQLKKLPDWVEERRQNAELLTNNLKNIPGLSIPVPPENIQHSYYRLYVFIDLEQLKPEWNQSRLLREICNEGVPCFTGSCPEMYREKAFVDENFPDYPRLPNAYISGKSSLAFLVHPGISKTDLLNVAAAVKKVFADAVDC